MTSSAVISSDGLYRYVLERRWDDRPLMAWCMLNPSTADAEVDDPTIRRCMGFARRENCGGIHVVNLMAFRAKSPVVCLRAPDPVGPENEIYWGKAAAISELGIVCAWGTKAPFSIAVRALAAFGRAHLWCLGETKAGDPLHPLRLGKERPLRQYTGW